MRIRTPVIVAAALAGALLPLVRIPEPTVPPPLTSPIEGQLDEFGREARFCPPPSIAPSEDPGAPSVSDNAAAVLESDETTEVSPAPAGNWARELEEFRKLAAADPETVLTRIAQVSSREEREAALNEVCLQLTAKDPALALNAAWDFQLGKLGGLTEKSTLENLAGRWAQSDLPAALAWINEHPPDEDGLRDRIVKGIASVWSQSAPADAAQLVAEQMNPERAQIDAAMAVVGRWAVIDFSGASAWVDLFPEGPLRDRGRAVLTSAAPGPRRF